MINYQHPLARKLQARAIVQRRRANRIEDKLSPDKMVYERNATGLEHDARELEMLSKTIIGRPISYIAGLYYWIMG
jgi:hypothetical protein